MLMLGSINIYFFFIAPEFFLFTAIPTIVWILFYSYWTFVKRRVRLRNNNVDADEIEAA